MDLVGQCQKCGLLIRGACALREEGRLTHFNLVACFRFAKRRVGRPQWYQLVSDGSANR